MPKHVMEVGIFVALAMVLRRKPDALISVLPNLRENSRYQGQDKLPVIMWMMLQASQGDLAVGLYLWANHLLPIIGGKNCNPQSRDLILQLVEWILSASKARIILVNGAVRKGERLVLPSSFDATERFEAIYPILKEVALAGSHGSKAMWQASQQMFNFAIVAVGESSPALSKEAAEIVIWCLNQNADCYRQWEDKVYLDNLKAGVAVLKRFSEEWKEQTANFVTLDPMREAIKNFTNKNEKAMNGAADSAESAFFHDAEKYCKHISRKLTRGCGYIKTLAVGVVAFAVSAAVVSPNINVQEWNKLYCFRLLINLPVYRLCFQIHSFPQFLTERSVACDWGFDEKNVL